MNSTGDAEILFKKTFDAASCNRCGACFSKCPVVSLPEAQAKQEISNVIDDRASNSVLGNCTSCMACKLYCQQGSDPHALITKRWRERYNKKGLPVSLELTLPYQFPTVYTKALDAYPATWKALVASWDHLPQDGGIALYAGCNMILQPYMLDSKLFDGINVFGSGNMCCAEPLFRMGLWDVEKQAASHVQSLFSTIKADEIIVPCLACYYMLTVVYPKLFDARIDAKFTPLLDWLHARIDSGEIALNHPFKETTVTIHDNCWPKIGGNHFFDIARTIVKATGCDVVEMPHNRENARCCGMGGVAASYSVTYGLKSGIDRLQEAKATGARFLVDYCGGCNWFLGTSKLMSLKRLPDVYHVLQLVQHATGERMLNDDNKRVAKKIMNATMRYLVPKTLSRKRFWYGKIENQAEPANVYKRPA
jgi:Fe-S oxidoreductase